MSEFSLITYVKWTWQNINILLYLLSEENTEIPLQMQKHIQTESEGMEKILHANRNKQKKAGIVVLLLDETDFKQSCNKDKDGLT